MEKQCECNEKYYAKGLCKQCYEKEYYQKANIKIKKNKYHKSPKYKLWLKNYRQKPKTKEQRRIENKKYHSKPEVREKAKQNYLEIKNKSPEIIKQVKIQRNKQRNKRYKNDILFNLKCKMRTRFRNFLQRKQFNKNDSTGNIIGCTPKELKAYIEKQFTSGMSWDLILSGKIHIDHIIPLDTATSEDDIYNLFHYKNLQPLWENDNLIKHTQINWIRKRGQPKPPLF